LAQQPDFQELASFFPSMGGSYNHNQLPLLKNALTQIWEKQASNLQEWVTQEKFANQRNRSLQCQLSGHSQFGT